MKAAELLDMLYASVTPVERSRARKRGPWWPGGVFLREVEAPPQPIFGPRGGFKGYETTRRADAIWVKKGDYRIHGYEIKVTRADLDAELRQPEKCVAWKQYCDTWTLVGPSVAFTEGYDIPEDWGILAPPSGRAVRAMTVVRPAAKLTPIDQGPAFNRIISAFAWRSNVTDIAAKAFEKENARLREEVAEWEKVWAHTLGEEVA